MEQWEIDLRKQLDGKIASKSKVTEAVEEIESLPKVASKIGTTSILALLILLGIGILVAYDFKTGNIQSWVEAQLASPEECAGDPVKCPPVVAKGGTDTEISALKNDIKRLEAESKGRLDKLDTNTAWNTQQINLMGMVMNENFMVIRNNHTKAHLIFFNRDWTIDQMPHYLELSSEDKEYLKKYVKTQ